MHIWHCGALNSEKGHIFVAWTSGNDSWLRRWMWVKELSALCFYVINKATRIISCSLACLVYVLPLSCEKNIKNLKNISETSWKWPVSVGSSAAVPFCWSNPYLKRTLGKTRHRLFVCKIERANQNQLQSWQTAVSGACDPAVTGMWPHIKTHTRWMEREMDGWRDWEIRIKERAAHQRETRGRTVLWMELAGDFPMDKETESQTND